MPSGVRMISSLTWVLSANYIAHETGRRSWLQPPAQYVQPASRARLTPQVPEGRTVTPGSKLAVHSFNASSGVTPAFAASRRLWPRSATPHAPITVPLASKRSRAVSAFASTPGFGSNHGFFTAGALVSGSRILNDSPIFYFFHMALPTAY